MRLEFEAVIITDLRVYSDNKAAFLEIEVDKNGKLYTGLGEFGGKDVDMTVQLFLRRFAPAILGQSFTSPLQLFDRISCFEFNYKMMGVQYSKALCGIDAALWDVFAKIENVSVSKLISSQKPCPINVYASSINRAMPIEDLANNLKLLSKNHGISAFKVKIGQRMSSSNHVSEEEIENLNYLLSKLPNSRIAIDCNGAFNATTDFTALTKVKNGKLWFIEEPYPWYRYSSYETFLQQNEKLLLAGGEQEFRRDVWKSNSNLFYIAQPDIGYSGGFTELILISQYHNFIIPHSPQNDLMPIMSWHFLNIVQQEEKYIELGCVDDGLVQVKLNSQGLYKPVYFKESIKVSGGKFSLESDRTGWGVSLDPAWKATAITTTYSNSTNSKRSFL